jgi:hypothetical protein
VDDDRTVATVDHAYLERVAGSIAANEHGETFVDANDAEDRGLHLLDPTADEPDVASRRSAMP